MSSSPEINALLQDIETVASTRLDRPDESYSQLMYAPRLDENTILDIDSSASTRLTKDQLRHKLITSVNVATEEVVIASVSISETTGQEERGADVTMRQDLLSLARAGFTRYLRDGDAIGNSTIEVFDRIINGTRESKWRATPLALPPLTSGRTPAERWLIAIPTELREQFLESTRLALARRGLLYSTASILRHLDNSAYVLIGSRSNSDGLMYTNNSPLFVQLSEGSTTYCLDKIGDTFDQKTFQGPPETWHRDTPGHEVVTVVLDEHTTATATRLNPAHIIEKERMERALGMYEPSVEVLTKIRRALDRIT